MTGLNGKYGSGPQQLIKNRLPKAYLCFGWGLLALFIPAYLFAAGDVVLPVGMYLFCAVLAVWFIRKGFYWEKRIKQAQQGGEAEDKIGKLLEQLPGWRIEHGLYFEKIGDVDFVVTSPDGRSFVIDVKSHKGMVSNASGKLSIVTDLRAFNVFDTQFLDKIKRQVELVALFRGTRCIEPVLVFTQAKVHNSCCVIDGVTVVEATALLDLLTSNSKPKERATGNDVLFDSDARIAIVKTLDKLPKGWTWEQRNVGATYDTADFFVQSSDGTGFVVNVYTESGRITRRNGAPMSIDEDELLRHSRRHAAALASERNLRWIHSVVVCFDRRRSVPDGKKDHVFIVRPSTLTFFLENFTKQGGGYA